MKELEQQHSVSQILFHLLSERWTDGKKILGATKSELKAILGQRWSYYLAYFDQQIRKYGLHVSAISTENRFALVSNTNITQEFPSSELNYKVLGTLVMFCVLLGIKEGLKGIPIKELAKNRKLRLTTVKTHVIKLQEKGYVKLDTKTNTVTPTENFFHEIDLRETYKRLTTLFNEQTEVTQSILA